MNFLLLLCVAFLSPVACVTDGTTPPPDTTSPPTITPLTPTEIFPAGGNHCGNDGADGGNDGSNSNQSSNRGTGVDWRDISHHDERKLTGKEKRALLRLRCALLQLRRRRALLLKERKAGIQRPPSMSNDACSGPSGGGIISNGNGNIAPNLDQQPHELQFFVDGTEEGLPIEADANWTFAELRKAASDDGLEVDGALFFVRGKTIVPATQEHRKWAKYVEGESVHMHAVRLCENCDADPVAFECLSCDSRLLLCADCARVHRKSTATRSHELRPLASPSAQASVHAANAPTKGIQVPREMFYRCPSPLKFMVDKEHTFSLTKEFDEDHMLATVFVDPPLPDGIRLNNETGAIEGTPTESQYSRWYTVTGTLNTVENGQLRIHTFRRKVNILVTDPHGRPVAPSQNGASLREPDIEDIWKPNRLQTGQCMNGEDKKACTMCMGMCSWTPCLMSMKDLQVHVHAFNGGQQELPTWEAILAFAPHITLEPIVRRDGGVTMVPRYRKTSEVLGVRNTDPGQCVSLTPNGCQHSEETRPINGVTTFNCHKSKYRVSGPMLAKEWSSQNGTDLTDMIAHAHEILRSSKG